MAEVLIRLERPARLTPELRAWLADWMNGGQAILSRGPANGSNRSRLVLRVEVPGATDQAVQNGIADLMTDLRLLGLRPALVSDPLVSGR